METNEKLPVKFKRALSSVDIARTQTEAVSSEVWTVDSKGICTVGAAGCVEEAQHPGGPCEPCDDGLGHGG